ncbi:class I SAM-dependent methyltransferase [Luteitalea sp.]
MHPRVMEWLREWRRNATVSLAVDIGCGSGLSTRPLMAMARQAVGFDPVEAMVRVAQRTAPSARFITARGEAMPFAAASVDLLTAAGSLNYASDLDATLREAARVLAPGGVLAVYDFSPGRSFADSDALDRWFEAFLARYPFPASQARPLSPAILRDVATGFTVERGEPFELTLPHALDFHIAYMLTETSVRDAVRRGTPLEDVRAWVTETLTPVFGSTTRDVVFRGYLATLIPRRR